MKFRKIKIISIFVILNLLTIFNLNYLSKKAVPLEIPNIFLGKGIFKLIFYIFLLLNAINVFLIYKKHRKISINYILSLVFINLIAYLFFFERLYGISFIVLIGMIINYIIEWIRFFKTSKFFHLFITCFLVFTLYVGILNFYVWVYNEM